MNWSTEIRRLSLGLCEEVENRTRYCREMIFRAERHEYLTEDENPRKNTPLLDVRWEGRGGSLSREYWRLCKERGMVEWK